MEYGKPKLLIFTDWYLPGYQAGGPVRSVANLATELSERIEIFIVCRDRDYLSEAPYPNLSPNTWIQRSEAQVQYLDRDHQSYSTVRAIITSFSKDTVVYVNGMFSPVFSVFPLQIALKVKLRSILAPRGMLAASALSIKPIRKKILISALRLAGMYRGVHFHATSNDERKNIMDVLYVAKSNISVIPNIPTSPRPNSRIPKKTGSLRILQVARIAPEKNTLFLFQILSSIPESLSVNCKIIGPVYNQAYFGDCKKELAKLPSHITVEFAGSAIPEEIQMQYANFDLFLLPTLGENYGHAIIDAMLQGCPVLISDRTPWKGLKTLGLGAEFSLESANSYVDFICTLARMTEAEYQEIYGSVSLRAAALIQKPDMIAKYLNLFHG